MNSGPPDNKQYDVLIIGGGMVGASMACALAALPLKIAIVEAFPFKANNQPSYDARSIALAYGSKRIFESLGLWDDLQADATAIKNIHISNQGQCGVTRLDATSERLPALGYVIENRNLGNALLKKLETFDNVDLICPAKLNNLQITEAYADVEIQQGEKTINLRCKLVIGADGGNSKVRQLIDIDSSVKDYHQTAVISNVTPGKSHNNTAYERFTPQGPIAVLPMSDNRCSLVLTVNNESLDQVLAMDDETFLTHLESRFGFRTGGFSKTSARHAYPLNLMKINQHYKNRAVIIGNAAHTLHPIAGQGFNLGIRDVSVLSQVIADAVKNNTDIGDASVLKNYEQQRKLDQKKVAFITDNLANIFSNDFFPLTKLRSKGLALADILPPAKHFIAKEAMGLSGPLPKLSRGLPL